MWITIKRKIRSLMISAVVFATITTGQVYMAMPIIRQYVMEQQFKSAIAEHRAEQKESSGVETLIGVIHAVIKLGLRGIQI